MSGMVRGQMNESKSWYRPITHYIFFEWVLGVFRFKVIFLLKQILQQR